MQELNASVGIDQQLWREDIEGSIAHVGGLLRAQVLSEAEAAELVSGLEQIAGEIERGEFAWDAAREDVHMNIEARLVELRGPLGGKLHTGRSRNDEVATDLRLWTRRQLGSLRPALTALATTLLDRAEEQLETLMPAYTHLQRAQPSRLSHHLLAWQEMLWRDRGRLGDALLRLNECPLGAGAVAGTGFPLDREQVARSLGFRRAMRNSIDATASRDFLIEVASAVALLGVHLSRISEELVLWSSQEFGFVTLSDAFTTSSSMMPQKKNPDVAELVRGKSALLIGSVTSLLVLQKGLGLGYARDLQEDKRPIFEACGNALVSLRALQGALATATFHPSKLQGALSAGHLCATDLADYLVQQGLAFREAHHLVGSLVREAEARGVQLAQLGSEPLGAVHPALDPAAVRSVLDPAAAVERRAVAGGPARQCVVAAIADARRRWAGAD
jgi:argininosuccinate lyase